MHNRGIGRGCGPGSALRLFWVGAVACCAALGPSAEERNLRFEHFYPESGLSQGSVKCLLQDHRGFLWLGTEDGLNRYDGYRFTVFRHDDRDSTSLPHSYIQALELDHEGMIWVGTRAGLARQTANGNFERFQHDAALDSSLPNDEILAIQELRDGSMWIGTRSGLSRYDRGSGTFETFRHDPADPDSLGSNVITALYQDRWGRLWIGTDGGGLSRWKPMVRRFETYRHERENGTSLSDDRVSAIREDSVGRLWVGSLGGTIDRFDEETNSFTHHVGPAGSARLKAFGPIRTLYPDGERNLWAGTDSGLVAFYPDEGRSEIYHRDEADGRTLSDDRVLSVLTDASDMLWVGTSNGLNNTNLRSSYFRVTHSGSGADDLTNGVVTAIHAVAGGVWIGTFGGGLAFRDDTSGHFTRYVHDADSPDSLSGDRVMSLTVSRDGTVWAGTFRGGLNRLDPGSTRFRHYVHHPEDPRSLSSNGITALLEDRSGQIWVSAFNGGIHRYRPDSDDFEFYGHDAEDPTSLPDPRVLAMFEDRQGAIWLGTATAGIAQLDPKTGQFTSYRPASDTPGALSAAAVYSFSEDVEGSLWIGTQGGLHRWNSVDRAAKRAKFVRYTTADGLPNNVIYGILRDEAGAFWLSTNHGLSRFDARHSTFTNFDTSHGLQGLEFNIGAYHRSPSGELFFGGTNGYNRFDPRLIGSNGHVPPVLITAIRSLNDPLPLDRPTWDVDQVDVGHKDYVISFEFSALDFVDPDRNQYAYMLEGLDDDWIQLGHDRRATYTNLAAGRYKLRVRAANNDGLWNNTGTDLTLTVHPPPWKTWWAYSLYLLGIALLLGAYVRAVRRKLRREAEYSRRLEAEVALRTEQLGCSNSALQAANLQLESAALTDPLTGLFNRRYLMTSVESEVSAAERIHRNRPAKPEDGVDSVRDFAFIVIDLDAFKSINDTYGHDAGDRAIRQTADLLRSCSRGSDSLIRLGGDEFMVVARDVTTAGTQVLATRICDRIANHLFDLGEGIKKRMSCSLGYSFYPFLLDAPTQVKTNEVITIADRALYLGKSGGRNAYVGIRANEKTPKEGLVAAILEDLDGMIENGLLEMDSSLAADPNAAPGRA